MYARTLPHLVLRNNKIIFGLFKPVFDKRAKRMTGNRGESGGRREANSHGAPFESRLLLRALPPVHGPTTQ